MREYTSKVDKLEEAENLRVTEAKETEYKPVVMGKLLTNFLIVTSTLLTHDWALLFGCH